MTSGINAILNRLKNSAVVRPVFNLVPVSAKAWLRRLVDWVGQPSLKTRLLREATQTNSLLSLYIYEEHRRAVAAADPDRLVACGFKQYSQHDEDGIIEEIFRRIGVTDRTFIEFGVGDGTENCTVYLLLQGWNGLWIEGERFPLRPPFVSSTTLLPNSASGFCVPSLRPRTFSTSLPRQACLVSPIC